MKNISNNKKNILFIDPYIKNSNASSFNRLVNLFPNVKMSYYAPAWTNFEHYQIPVADGIIISGSASHVFEKLDWQINLAKEMKQRLENGVPVLGLCFGHQLLGHTFGGELDFVYPDTQDKMVGSRKMSWNGKSYVLGVTHRQKIVGLKDKAILLEKEINILSHDILEHHELPYLGTQGHPEASEEFLRFTCEVVDPLERKKIIKSSDDFLQDWNNHFFK